ncbi:MAG: CPBP family intramembrane metalloprotease [Victivallales bacterium]|jgi:membrane protease YdiL (CAAX protease family)|nr:CPBP family intramembrane metalloprotease [Victivallales bacterium]
MQQLRGSLNLPNTPPWRNSLSYRSLLAVFFGGLSIGVLGSLGAELLFAVTLGDLQSPKVIIVAMAGQYLSLPVMLFWLYRSLPRGELFAKLGLCKLKKGDWRAILTGIVLIILSNEILTSAWKMLLDYFGVVYYEQQNILALLSQADFFTVLGMGICTIIGAPIIEEIFFRRLLYELLLPLGTIRAILLGSFLFAVIHFFLLGIPALFFMGLVFQIIFLLRGNLACAMIAHAVANLLAFAGTLLVA